MKIQRSKSFQIFLLFFLLISFSVSSLTIEKGDYKLEIIERSGRFKFFKKNIDGKFISLFSDSDSRTSTFSIFENNGFYKLGDTFRYKKNFVESSDGGKFSWTSKELFIEQEFILDNDGFLEISFRITNISGTSKTAGLKFLLDTDYENDDYFYLVKGREGLEIINEYEIENPDETLYWTSAVRNPKGVSLMSITTETAPDRSIFGNWDILNDAGYYYSTASGRSFNNPPYSINDNAVLYLYSPVELSTQGKWEIDLLFRAIDSVENYREIIFKKKRVEQEVIPVEKIAIEETETAEKEEKEEAETVVEDVIPVLEKVEDETEEEPKEPTDETLPEAEPEPVTDPEPIKKIEPVVTIPLDEEPIAEPEPEVSDAEADVSDRTEEQLEKLSDIKDIIESISRPGIITEADISALEDLIKKLEEIGTDEN